MFLSLFTLAQFTIAIVVIFFTNLYFLSLPNKRFCNIKFLVICSKRVPFSFLTTRSHFIFHLAWNGIKRRAAEKQNSYLLHLIVSCLHVCLIHTNHRCDTFCTFHFCTFLASCIECVFFIFTFNSFGITEHAVVVHNLFFL